MSDPFVQRLANSGNGLADGDCAALAHLTRNARSFDAGDILAREGEPVARMLVMLNGWALRYQITDDGQRQIIALILPGDACHLHAMALAVADHDIVTATSCRVAEVAPYELARLIEERPAVLHALQWSCLQNESILRAGLTNIGRRRADRRIAHLLCEIHARLQAVGLVEDGRFAWPLTQNEVADATGMTNVHVNRSYKELHVAKLFTLKNRCMHVPDVERLAAFGGFRSDYLRLVPHATLAASDP